MSRGERGPAWEGKKAWREGLTSCALSFPLTRASKSSSESVMVQPAFIPLGSPGYTAPGGFFKSTATIGEKNSQ